MKKIHILGALVLALLVIGYYVYSQQQVESPQELTTEQMMTKGEMVTYYEEKGVTGYLAVPEGEGPFPALILIHEWWGLNENVKNLADDFAKEGYIALAVDLYEGQLAQDTTQAGELAGQVRSNLEPAFANLNTAVAYLKNLDNVDSEKLASVGWCFGGGWAYQMAKNDLGVKASVMYYGQFSLEDDLEMMKADIIGHFGEEDRSIPVDDVKEFQAKLKTISGDHEVYIYENAGHAFANEDNQEAYREESAQEARDRTISFLARVME
jgi:carboxymethylenebutenolidase